ncbi:unnamed protein product, partial [Phaeothamnion confervicola]
MLAAPGTVSPSDAISKHEGGGGLPNFHRRSPEGDVACGGGDCGGLLRREEVAVLAVCSAAALLLPVAARRFGLSGEGTPPFGDDDYRRPAPRLVIGPCSGGDLTTFIKDAGALTCVLYMNENDN